MNACFFLKKKNREFAAAALISFKEILYLRLPHGHHKQTLVTQAHRGLVSPVARVVDQPVDGLEAVATRISRIVGVEDGAVGEEVLDVDRMIITVARIALASTSSSSSSTFVDISLVEIIQKVPVVQVILAPTDSILFQLRAAAAAATASYQPGHSPVQTPL